MDVKIEEILSTTKGRLVGAASEDIPVQKVSTDSRTIDKNDLFFALRGAQFDGHEFIKEAFEKGARHFVVMDTKSVLPEYKTSANFILVEDTLKAYGDLAKFYRQKFKIPAVAITGSSGKTTVKELTAHILSQSFKVLRNRGTENNLVGVPKTIFGLDETHQVLVLEMGTNQPGEIERLSSIIAPQIGLVTQIGQAHLEGLATQEGIKTEKLSLLNNIERGGLLILNGQDPMLQDVRSGVHRILRAGFTKEANDIVADQVWCHEEGSSFQVNGRGIFETPLIGRHNVLNCLLAILVADSLGVELSLIKKALSSFKAIPGRLQFKIVDGYYFLDDSYNSNPTSFKASLETLKEFKIRERKGVVCGDMLELGEGAEKLHREIGAMIAQLLFDYVIATGPLSKFLVDEALKHGFDPKRIYHVKDSVEAGKLCREIATPGDRILVKGSRGTHMEKVFECFITSSTR